MLVDPEINGTRDGGTDALGRGTVGKVDTGTELN